MELKTFKAELESLRTKDNNVIEYDIPKLGKMRVYPKSIHQAGEKTFFIAKNDLFKNLYIIGHLQNKAEMKFHGETIWKDEDTFLKCASLSNVNRKLLQEVFEFTRPVVLGLTNSFGFGDRIGLANPGHVRSLDISGFKPILAQQSIRELTRTERTADEVVDAAVWSVFQEGYTEGFGADADHLKTTEDIDRMVKAGYRMFTFDPSDYVNNESDNYDEDKLLSELSRMPWKQLKDSYPDAENRFLSEKIKINDDYFITPTDMDLLKAYAKYGKALAYVKQLYDHLKNEHAGYESEVEISVDETESVTTPFEHYFIASELQRLKVEFVSLAPRFIGDFEKGIDYKGDLKIFEEEYKKHLAVVELFGNYKISLHSGSDKFTVYKIIGGLKKGYVHVKTAGTSYLEALKVVALKQPALFREILDYSSGLYLSEKKTYHVSADINKVKKAAEYSDAELVELFNSDDCRQVLHVTFGKILTDKNNSGSYVFKDKIIECLKRNEETHYEVLINHFYKHLEPFN